MKNRSECLVCGDGSEKKEDEISEKRERRIQFSFFCVCWSFSISFYTFAAPILAAVAGCMREQNRNYVDCEKSEKWNWGEYEKSNLITNWKLSAIRKTAKGSSTHERKKKRFRAPQWDLCEMMGMRWRKILLSDSIARRRAAAITDNVRKKKEMVKNDICDVTLALRRVESCTALPNLHPDEIELVPIELTHHPLELCVLRNIPIKWASLEWFLRTIFIALRDKHNSDVD